MQSNLLSTIGLLQGVSVFVLVISVWVVGVILWQIRRTSQGDKLARRMDITQHPAHANPRVLRLWHDGRVRTTLVAGGPRKKSILARLDDMRRILGWEMPLGTFILGIVGVSCLVFAVTFALTRNPLLSFIGAVGVIAVLRTIARGRAQRESEVFERQLAEALGLAARSLRAGHPVLAAFQLIVDESEAPIRDTFGEIIQQQALGKSLEESIRTTAEASSSTDLKLFAASMIIQLQSGGNLADMMDRLDEVIRDRIKLHRKARVLTSQTKMSKDILIAIPLMLFAYLYFFKPGYLEPLYTTYPGKVMLVIAAACLITGTWIMNKIAELHY